MPNYCNNTLRVETVRNNKVSKNQLKQFIEDVCDKGEVASLKEAKEVRKKHLEENLNTEYRDNVELYVKHKKMSIKKFMTEVLGFEFDKEKEEFFKDRSEFSMNKILPTPEELRKVTAPVRAENGETEEEFKARVKRHQKLYGASDWYEWNCANWGTKWDACDVSFEDISSTEVSYFFNTAWSPICPFLETIGKMYPLLKFSLYCEESGNDFAGDYVVESGEVTEDETRSCPVTCGCCGEELEEGEELNDDGDCPSCAEDNNDDDE